MLFGGSCSRTYDESGTIGSLSQLGFTCKRTRADDGKELEHLPSPFGFVCCCSEMRERPMNGRERVLAMIDHRPVDRIPLMPITMMLAADQIGVKYGRYVRDFRVLVEAQLFTTEKFDIDQVSCISDPAREAVDLGATVRYFSDQPPAFSETEALLADKTILGRLKVPDPSGRRPDARPSERRSFAEGTNRGRENCRRMD